MRKMGVRYEVGLRDIPGEAKIFDSHREAKQYAMEMSKADDQVYVICKVEEIDWRKEKYE